MLSITLCATLTSGLMVSCNTNDGGTEIPNELVGKEYIAGQGPAADAEIKLIPVGYLPGAPGADSGKGVLVSGRTDGHGRFSFANLAPGQYNVLVSKDGLHSLRDSVSITGERQALAADTLKAPGSITGYVALEGLDAPRSATVQVLGTTVFVNVEPSGAFNLNALAPGQYRFTIRLTAPVNPGPPQTAASAQLLLTR